MMIIVYWTRRVDLTQDLKQSYNCLWKNWSSQKAWNQTHNAKLRLAAKTCLWETEGEKKKKRENQPSNTRFTVWQQEHLTFLAPLGYESKRRQEPQTIWAISVTIAHQWE